MVKSKKFPRLVELSLRDASERAANTPLTGSASKTEKNTSDALVRRRMNDFFIHASRIVFSGLLAFESLNAFGVLNFHITYSWPGLIIIAAGIWFILEKIQAYIRQTTKKNSFGALALAASVAVLADAMADVFSLFDKFAWYDQVMHFFAGGATCGGIVFYILKSLREQGRFRFNDIGIGFSAWLITIFFGVLYELAEYAQDYFTGSNSLVSAADTANDLFLDTVGALSVLIFLTLALHYGSGRSHTSDKVA